MKSILIIDDDEFILFGLSKAICGCIKDSAVVTARHGRQAVEILQDRHVDVVVTDLKMPVMNGYEVVDYVNRHFPELPVYVMTGDYLPDVMPRFQTASVSQFVSKPFSFRQVASDILATIDRAAEPATA
ncbi:MAG: hypothetical protein A2078_13135 [Nitrospirae bacterium GWC2_57_9]|nr:MAG: hypothetical protein A2078_13135 [Nitrospirae bacterium GWC2_57_9]